MADASPHASPFDALLDECLELVVGRLQAAVAGMMDKADESLVAMTGATQNREAQQLYQQTRQILAAQRGKLEGEFHKAYLQEFNKHASKAKSENQVFSEIEITLSIVGDDDLEENLRFKERAAKLRRFCDEELAALDQRVGVLLGDANLAAEANPFGPESIGEAYKKACHALGDADAKVRGVLLQLFDDHVIDHVRSIYKDVNALLVKNSILPKIRYGVAKKAEGPKGAGGKDEDEEEAEGKQGEAEKPTEENLFAMLQSLVAQGGGGGGGGVQLPPGAVILQGAELVGSLNNLQQQLQALHLGEGAALPEGVTAAAAAGEANVLKELKASTFGAQMQGMDAATLDIVSLLFDQLFEDPKIPAALKGLIGRLQIPMLKVAISDKALFSKKTHPARQLLDTFGDVAVRLGEDFNADSPTFVHLEAIVQHLVTSFQEDVGVFERAREQLKEVIAGHDRQVEEQAQAEAKRIEQAENLSAAKSAAEAEVKQRVQAHSLPGPVLEFLVQQWLRYLLIHHAKAGSGSAEWKDAVETMDQLVQSLEPVKTADERKKLAASVPGLVRKLVVGMNAVGTEPQAREQFLGALMKCHTLALAKPKEGAPPAPPPAPAAPAATPAEALDFTAPVKVQNPYGEGSVEVVGLDFTPKPVDKAQRASAKAALMSSLSVEPPAGLDMGSWVEFRSKNEGEPPRTAKLLFVSPRKTRYLFSDRRGKDVLELTRAEIVRRLRTGEAVRLKEEPSEPLFDRFMNGVMGKLRAPAAKAAA